MTDFSHLSDEELLAIARGEDAPKPSFDHLTDKELLQIAAQGGASGSMHRANPYLEDIGKSFATGIGEGVIGVAGLPGTLADLATQGADWLYRKGHGFVTGEEPVPLSSLPGYRSNPGSAASIKGFIEDHATGEFYKPKTTVGEYARTIGEFAPGALIGPGSAAGNIARYGLAPAVASETAGQAMEGSDYEGVARVVAALGTAGGMAQAGRAPYAERFVGTHGRGIDDSTIQAATRLMVDAEKRGVMLTPAEAIQHVTGGGTKLSDLQRIVESTTEGGAKMAAAMAERPAQGRAAIEQALNQIGPRSQRPGYLGVEAQDAATRRLAEIEQVRTNAVTPAYTAAKADVVPEEGMRAILAEMDAAAAADKTGIVGGRLGELRRHLIASPAQSGTPAARTPVLGPGGRVLHYEMTPAVPGRPEIPITDVGNLDRVRKYYRDRLDLPQIGEDAITKEQGAAITRYLDQIDELMLSNSPQLGVGRQQFQDISEQTVGPSQASPLGKIAATDDIRAQGRALMGEAPSPQEVQFAAQQMMRAEPVARGIVREHLGGIADRTVGGLDNAGRPDQYGGAKFAREVRGNPREAENIRTAIREVAGPISEAEIDRVIDILQATGWRQRPGSQTASNLSTQGDLQRGGPEQIAQLVTKPLSTIREAYARQRLGSQSEALADLLLAGPTGLERVRRPVAQGSDLPEILARLLMAGRPGMEDLVEQP